jgi:hypothetical protein
MFSKKEAAKLRHDFWTSFGQYMSPVLSADGEHINWINYRTGVKGLFFKIQVDQKITSIAIELRQEDLHQQALYFDQLIALKKVLEETVGEQWQWSQRITDEHGAIVSRVGTQQDGLNIYRKENWPAIISFLKPRIISLDAFWNMAKYGFEVLQ